MTRSFLTVYISDTIITDVSRHGRCLRSNENVSEAFIHSNQPCDVSSLFVDWIISPGAGAAGV